MVGRGGVVVRFSLSHVGILGKKYTCSGFYLESEKKVVPELEFEGEGHGKQEDMESAYMVISHIISRKC